MASIQIENLHQVYGEIHALTQVNLEIREGEFFSLLGPSGSGKTTLLRLIAGFEPPEGGTIRIDGEDVTRLPPERRRVGMVFQNYALFPHLDVFENVAYGLRAQKAKRETLRRRVRAMLELVDLSGFESRDVHSLSGGQQQRVALARAVAPHPRVLLMDEPLSNLDARLRLQTRRQIRDLQRQLGMTTVYVTHDQSEAFALSDRLALMLDGRIIQVGTPKEVYESPQSTQSADFLGEMNWLACPISKIANGPGWRVDLLENTLDVPDCRLNGTLPDAGSVLVGIRPESFGPAGAYPHRFEVHIRSVQYEGGVWRLETERERERLLMTWPAPWLRTEPEVGSRCVVSFDSRLVSFFPVGAA